MSCLHGGARDSARARALSAPPIYPTPPPSIAEPHKAKAPGQPPPGPCRAYVPPTLRGGDILEIHVRAAVPHERERPPETSWAGVAAPRKRLLPAALHHFTHRVGAIRQTGEHVVPRRVGEHGCRDRPGELAAPVREAGPRICAKLHPSIDRQRSAGRRRRDVARRR